MAQERKGEFDLVRFSLVNRVLQIQHLVRLVAQTPQRMLCDKLVCCVCFGFRIVCYLCSGFEIVNCAGSNFKIACKSRGGMHAMCKEYPGLQAWAENHLFALCSDKERLCFGELSRILLI
jgi:hypothetical protein